MNIIPIKKRQKDLHNFKRQIANASYCSQIYDNSFTSQTRILFKNQYSLLVAVLLFHPFTQQLSRNAFITTKC